MTPSPGVPREPSAVAVGGSPGVFPFAPWRHRLSLLLVASTLALIFVGGLVTSTLLTLFVIPAAYRWFDLGPESKE